MTLQPTHLELAPGGLLEIVWSDGARRRCAPAELRKHCPCAACNSERRRAEEGGQPFTPPADVQVHQMRPVGNYGYNIAFSDGHATGIFSLGLLRDLGQEV